MPFTMITGYIVRKSTVVFNLLNYRHSDVDVAYAIALDQMSSIYDTFQENHTEEKRRCLRLLL